MPQRPPGHRAPAVDVRPAGNGLQQLTLQLMPKPEMVTDLHIMGPDMASEHGPEQAFHCFQDHLQLPLSANLASPRSWFCAES